MVKTKTLYECEECGKEFDNKRALVGHVWFAHGKRIGEKTSLYDRAKRLERERRREKSDVLERIDEIDERLKNIEQLLTAEDQEENPGEEEEALTREDIKAMLEEEFEKRLNQFQEQLNEIHLDIEKKEEKKVVYKCPKCEQEFSNKEELSEHWDDKHGSGKWFF